ncbi:histidine-rich protein PFHRP-II-like [Musca domestica]|uniref:Histidine-rich protein PFHRP-II-like n=1 Tax=Musca domestica TaxID=7370 RepID=A0A1I8NAR6_MUSDO|nr:histidine-rich protein PFHRP-II-like [Musca domestica]
MRFLTIAVFVGLCVVGMAHDHHGYGHDDDHKHYSHPKYEFKYGVKDLKTEDIKEQWEHRDGDKVHGGYLLKEADGTTRVVNYHADDHSGFHADVKTIGHAKHPETHHSHHDDEHHDHHVEHNSQHSDSAKHHYSASSHHDDKEKVVKYTSHVEHDDHHSSHKHDGQHGHDYYSGDHHGHATSFVKVKHH